MSNYSDSPGHCRVDFFKPSGKWYDGGMIDMGELYGKKLIHEAVQDAVNKAYGDSFSGFTVVVLHPYHQSEHPILYVKP